MAIPPQIIVQRERRASARRSPRRSAERRGGPVEVRAAERGDKRRILELAERNARLALDQERLKAERRRQQRVEALDGLQDALGLDALPLRIECFDISNLDGHPHGRLDGRLRGRRAEEVRLPPLHDPRPRGGRARRLRRDGGGPRRAACAQWETQQDLARTTPSATSRSPRCPTSSSSTAARASSRPACARSQGFRERGVAVISLAKRIEEVFVPGRREPIVLAARHARAAAAAARARRGAPLRDHPPPHAPRPRDDDVDPRRPAGHRPGAQARAAGALRLARGGRWPPRARSSRRCPGCPARWRATSGRTCTGRATDALHARFTAMSDEPERLQDMAVKAQPRHRLRPGAAVATAAPSRPSAAPYAETRLEDLVVITGFSGAGKSTAMNVFEDAGYFCVDNLPPEMIRSLVELFVHEGSKVERAAVVSDVARRRLLRGAARGARRPRRARRCATASCSSTPTSRRCSTRYKETRRRHPLAPRRQRRARHRRRARAARAAARARRRRHRHDRPEGRTCCAARSPTSCCRATRRGKLAVTFESFGFKHGPRARRRPRLRRALPAQPALRARPAPADRPRPARSSTTSAATAQLEEFYDAPRARCSTSCCPQYVAEGKAHLTIAIGCTGGRHRSVAIAEHLAARYRERDDVFVEVAHRDITQADRRDGDRGPVLSRRGRARPAERLEPPLLRCGRTTN